MPRDLDATENSLTIRDAVSGGDVRFFYRTPAPSDMQAYASASIQRKGNKVIVAPVQPKLKAGLDIMTGVREGDFTYQGKPLSSDPKNENYQAAWKDILKEKAPDLIVLFAATIFDGSYVRQDKQAEVEIEEAGEEVVPFSKS